MDFFEKVLQPSDFSEILAIQNKEDIIALATTGNSMAFEQFVFLINCWCYRIDKLIELDRKLNEKPTWRSHLARRYRAFTYDEYPALFNQYISPDNFPNYPVFNSLGWKTHGINTLKQRQDFTNKYELNEEDYFKILRENGYQSLLEFFFGLRSFSLILPLKQLYAHTLVVAPSGYGKSELLRSLFYQMQKKYKKYSFVLIDPHGSLAQAVKRFNLNQNRDRLIYINPTLKEGQTPSFNPFEIGDNQSLKVQTHTAEQIITAFEEVLNRDSNRLLTDVMLNALEKCIYFLLERPESSFDDLLDLLNCKEPIFSEARQHNPTFFSDDFKRATNKTREALVNRFGRTMNSPILRNFLSGKSTFDLEAALNSGKVIILDIGDVGELTQEAIGKLFVASIKSIIRKRQKNKGLPTFLFIDEVHVLMSGSFDYILSQLRGYGLHLVLSHQYLGQLGKQAEAVLQNTAVKIIGGEDLDQIRKVIPVPKDEHLKLYEFFLKVRHRDLIRFKAPDDIISSPKKFELPAKELKALDRDQMEKYYKPIGSDNRTTAITKFNIKKESPKNIKKDIPVPPFKLLLKKNDKTNQQKTNPDS